MMTASIATSALAAFLLFGAVAYAAPDRSGCDAAVRTQAGWVCGVRRRASSGNEYASFRGVPYAKQPLGELRFQELQPLEPWTEVFNATTEGPVCPQTDVFYKGIQNHAGGMSEACIHANIHVPLEALDQTNNATRGLPILVFVHGGGFAFGSGDTDLYGPEYLVSKGVIVITFNYRLNVFGFLSLNSEWIPGNNGLRDCVSLLRWVRAHAAAFGGDPHDVTLAGHSAGAAMAHLLTLSATAEGLFKRVILFSGVGNGEFFSTSPVFAKIAAGLFLGKVGIPPTLDQEEIHRQLVRMPLKTIMGAHAELLDMFGLTVFSPVVEGARPVGTAIIDEDPEVLLERGRGREVPHLIGFTNSECETFRPRLAAIDIVGRIATTPTLLVSPELTYRIPSTAVPMLVKLIERRYFNESRTLDDFISYCSDAYYKYPAVKLAEKRAAAGTTPTFLYRFSFGGRRSAFKEAMRLNFAGAAHGEDITYVFRTNSVLGPVAEEAAWDEDDEMRDQMTDYIVNFMRYSDPTPDASPAEAWPSTRQPRPQLQDIEAPAVTEHRTLDKRLRDMVAFFDGLHRFSTGD